MPLAPVSTTKKNKKKPKPAKVTLPKTPWWMRDLDQEETESREHRRRKRVVAGRLLDAVDNVLDAVNDGRLLKLIKAVVAASGDAAVIRGAALGEAIMTGRDNAPLEPDDVDDAAQMRIVHDTFGHIDPAALTFLDVVGRAYAFGGVMPSTPPGGMPFLPRELASLKVAVGDADDDGKVDVSLTCVVAGKSLQPIIINVDLGTALSLFGGVRQAILKLLGR